MPIRWCYVIPYTIKLRGIRSDRDCMAQILPVESEENADSLFPSEDEVQPPPSKKHRKSKQAVSQPAAKPVVRASSLSQVSTAAAPLPVAACSSSSKKPYFKPIPPKIATAYDLFGTDSEDDEKADIPTTANFIRETRKEFVNCPQTYVSNYYSN
ncbi:hypothetical protein ACJJTC_014368 [Scirpophaga incertulas]